MQINYCKCGRKIRGCYAKKCLVCYKKDRRNNRKKYYCMDCGKIVGYRSKRCRKCEDKQHSIRMKGKNNPAYNPNKIIRRCMNCGKEIKNYYAKRCHSCAMKKKI